ncbi:MAG: hypothetical protein QXI07_08970 [Pyrobaculum sp.]
MRSEEVKKKIKESLSHSNVLLVAPMGWGKTTIAAEVADELASQGLRVGYIAPTLTLIDRKWDSLWSGLNTHVIATAGAGQLCARGHRYYPQRYCHRCPLNRAPPEGFAPPAKLHYSQLREMMPETICPYWVQEAIMPRYRILLGHYGRLRRFRGIDVAIIDEVHESIVPEIRQFSLSELREKYDAIDTTSVEALRESVESLLVIHGDDEDLWVLYDILRMPIVWIEDNTVYGALLRQLPRGVRVLGLTATPPPGWPPEGWEAVKIEVEKKPEVIVYSQYDWRYDYLSTVDATYHVSEMLRLALGNCVDCRVAVFATSSRQQLIDDATKQRYNIDVFDAWGRYRIGVDLLEYDAAVVFWPTLHISVRRHMRARGIDPNVAELVNAVQLAGRIRPANGDKIVIFAGARFAQYREYLSQFFDLQFI